MNLVAAAIITITIWSVGMIAIYTFLDPSSLIANILGAVVGISAGIGGVVIGEKL